MPSEPNSHEPLSARLDAARLELALEAGQLGLWEWDVDSGRVTWSPTLETIHGLEPGSFEGTFEAFQADIHPDDKERVVATIRQSLEGNEHRLDYRIITPAGETRFLEARGRLVRSDDGGIVRMIGVCVDVTDRKRSEQEKGLTDERFAITLESIGDGVIATDQRARITFMNAVAEALTGWSLDEARGRGVADVFRILHETTREPTASPVDKVLSDGTIVGLANHTVLVRRDGSELNIDDSAAPIRGPGGELEGAVLVFRDVTEKRQAQLRQQFIHDATLTLSESLDLETTLRKAAALAVPHVCDWCAIDLVAGEELRRVAVAHVDPDKVELAHEIHRRYKPDPDNPTGAYAVVRSGESQLVSPIPPELIEAVARDTEHRAIIERLGLSSYMVVPMCAGDRILGALSFVGEGRRKFVQEDLRLAEQLASVAAIAVQNASHHRELQRALTGREEMLGIVSHDLRNPLAVVQMGATTADMALQAGKLDAVQQSLARIERAGARMERLIGDLLNFAAISAGRLSVDVAPQPVEALVGEALEMCHGTAGENAVELEAMTEPGIGAVPCDRQRILQVLGNLLGNAVKFTDEGGRVTLSVQREGEKVAFAVRDTGAGIAPEELATLFEPYRRGGTQGEGVGLGLYIARGIVEAHGGSLWAESELGTGSTFHFVLPASP